MSPRPGEVWLADLGLAACHIDCESKRLADSVKRISWQFTKLSFEPGQRQRRNALHVGYTCLSQKAQARKRNFIFAATVLGRQWHIDG
jgi:hypothetical protein